MANILGFMFVIIGIMWIVEAFLARGYADLWWLNLVSGILMLVLGFWLSGQFLITQAAALLTFAGIWAMSEGLPRHRDFLHDAKRRRRHSDRMTPAGTGMTVPSS